MDYLLSPEVIEAASKSTLGAFSLMILVLGVIALVFFKDSPVSVRLSVFVALLFSITGYGYALIGAKSDLTSNVVWELNPSECSRIVTSANATISGNSGELVIRTHGPVGTAEVFCPITGLKTTKGHVSLVFNGAFINWNNNGGSGAASQIKVTASSTPEEAAGNITASSTIASKVAGVAAKRIPPGKVFDRLNSKTSKGLVVTCRSAWNNNPVQCEFQDIRLTSEG